MKYVTALIGLGVLALAYQTTQAYPAHALPPSGWGVVNSQITQENINQNICNPKWTTSSIRPSSSYTTSLKKKQLEEMNYTDTNLADYEEDHIISLEIGGDPVNPKNLYPEPYNMVYKRYDIGAHSKDKVENYLHAQVCNGSMTLSEAQKKISSDWIKVFLKINKNVIPSITDD